MHTVCYALANSFVRFPWGSDAKESACNAKDPGTIPGLERSPGDGSGIPGEFHGQRSLEGSSPQGPKESDTTEQLTLHIQAKS